MFCCGPWGYGTTGNWLFGAVFLALAGWGLWTFWRSRNAPPSSDLTTPCRHCGALLRDEWNNCPKCGGQR